MRILFFSIVLIILTSCSKEQRTNRKLDGEWNATVFMGYTPNSDESYTFTFNKDKDGEGTGTVKEVDGFYTDVYGMQYFIKNDRLTMIIDQDALVFTISSMTNQKITLIDTYDETTILEKK